MGQYDVHVNGKTIGRGDNFNYPTEGQYYAFDATDAVTAGQPVALGALYHYWTCTCQGRANGPCRTRPCPPRRPRARPTSGSGPSRLRLGDQITVGTGAAAETATVTASARPRGRHGLTVTPALSQPRERQAVIDHQGPTGLVMKAVVDHADGTRETFVTDGTWKIRKADQYTNSTVTPRNGDPATTPSATTRGPRSRLGHGGFDDSSWEPAYAIAPTRGR